MMLGCDSVQMFGNELTNKSSNNMERFHTQRKRKIQDCTTSSPQLLKYRKVSPVSFTTPDACDSVGLFGMASPEKVVLNYTCTGVDIKKYLKITKSKAKSYKLNLSNSLLDTEVTVQPAFRKITDYFKGSSSLKTPENASSEAIVAFDNNVTPPNPVKDAVEKSTKDPCLIGDFSQAHFLPTVKGKHPDIPSVSSETMARVLEGEYETSFIVLDCRYPYEFEGGHIVGAKNLYTKSEVSKKLFFSSSNLNKSSRPILIFHCEFSSERGPNMYRFVRNKDRELNAESYPSLHYPEMYVLEGGYSSFFTSHKKYCDPATYRMMRDESYVQDMVNCRAKCKADKGNNCRKSFRDRMRPRLLF